MIYLDVESAPAPQHRGPEFTMWVCMRIIARSGHRGCLEVCLFHGFATVDVVFPKLEHS